MQLQATTGSDERHRDAVGQVVVAERLVRRYGAVESVRGVSFAIAEGEVFRFLGPNGAGKTTTIGMLCTLLRPTPGTARVAGHDVVRERLAVRRSIGLVFQDPTIDQYLTEEENLRFHAYAFRVPRRERDHAMRELLELMEPWERRKDRVRDYSGGMKRRLELARGLLHLAPPVTPGPWRSRPDASDRRRQRAGPPGRSLDARHGGRPRAHRRDRPLRRRRDDAGGHRSPTAPARARHRPDRARSTCVARGQGGEELNSAHFRAARQPMEIRQVDGGHAGSIDAQQRECERRVVRFFEHALLGGS